MKATTTTNHKRTKSSSSSSRGGGSTNYTTRLPLAALLHPVHPNTYEHNVVTCHSNVSLNQKSSLPIPASKSSSLDVLHGSSLDEGSSEQSPSQSPQSSRVWIAESQLSNATRMSPSNNSSNKIFRFYQNMWNANRKFTRSTAQNGNGH